MRNRNQYHKRWRDNIRSLVLARDSYRCMVCSFVSVSNHVHHIDDNSLNNVSSNLITLCVSCHGMVSGKKLKFSLSNLLVESDRSRFFDNEISVVLSLAKFV